MNRVKALPIQESNARFLRIALISSNAAIRMGLRMILNTHSLVSEVDDLPLGATAVEIVALKKPQVIIVDLELADANTSELIRNLHAASADSNILVLSGLGDAKLIRDALAAGAEGVVLTIQPPAVLFAAIDSLCGFAPRPMDDPPVQSSIGLTHDRSSDRNNHRTQAGFIESLTSREREIVHFLAKGLKNKQIAERLYISETTVRHHFTAIFSKLHVSNRQQLLIAAHRQGLIEFGAVDALPT
jgi:DNA-binding NarL/FixJ family response regulator